MAEPPMFHMDWLFRIDQMLNNEDVNYPAILRVPTPLLDSKPAAYIPQFLSLGPCHHSKIEKDTKPFAECNISWAEEYKGKIAAMVSQNLRRRGENFKSIVELMKQMQPNIERFYHWPASTNFEYSLYFNLMMAIDSSFLLHWLFHLCFTTTEEHRLDTVRSCPFQVCIICDIMKLENQIPLFVLRNVFERVKQAGVFDEGVHFNKEMRKRCDRLHPFLVSPGQTEVNDALVEEEPHLMGCVHTLVSQFLQMGTSRNDNRSLLQKLKGISMDLLILPVVILFPYSIAFIERPDFTTSIERKFLKALTAEQLDQAGIKFEAFDKLPGSILFEQDSGTLYLPCINVSDMETEVFLRNMVALEFNDTTRPNSVTHYIALMNSLVSSTDDVRLLKRRGIIVTGIFGTDRVSDECIANMWSGMWQPSFKGELVYQAISDPLFEVLRKNYWRTKIDRMLLGPIDYVWSWKFLAPVAGFLGLALTAIQAYPVLFH